MPLVDETILASILTVRHPGSDDHPVAWEGRGRGGGPSSGRHRVMGMGAAALSLGSLEGCGVEARRPPSVVFIMADDLGYGEVGAYGQKKIRTPSIDRIAREGILFTQHYSGSPVCAPSRCVLLTGLHTGHAYIRDNDEMDERGDVRHDPELAGQRPLLEGTFTLGALFQEAGYVTGAVGKWGLGGSGSSGVHSGPLGGALFPLPPPPETRSCLCSHGHPDGPRGNPNVAPEYPEVVARISQIMREAPTESDLFPLLNG